MSSTPTAAAAVVDRRAIDPLAETVKSQQPTQADGESVRNEENNDPPPVSDRKDPPLPEEETVVSPNLQTASGPYASVGAGWSAMAKIVHDVDAQKVQDYKEDIDSILVFVRHIIGLTRLHL
jgi:hypothetical protein